MSHAGPFARRATSFALVLQSSAIVCRGCGGVKGHSRRGDSARESGWTANADFQGARDQHRQTSLCRPLKGRGGVFRSGRSGEIHVRSIGNRAAQSVFNTTHPCGIDLKGLTTFAVAGCPSP